MHCGQQRILHGAEERSGDDQRAHAEACRETDDEGPDGEAAGEDAGDGEKDAGRRHAGLRDRPAKKAPPPVVASEWIA